MGLKENTIGLSSRILHLLNPLHTAIDTPISQWEPKENDSFLFGNKRLIM